MRNPSLPLRTKLALMIGQWLVKPLLFSADGSLYAVMFNFWAMLRGKGVHARWNGQAKTFEVVDRSIRQEAAPRHVATKEWCHDAYSGGFAHRARLLSASYMLADIDFADNDLFMDVGANIGDMKLWFDFNGIAIDYVGFEPSPAEYRCLERNSPGCALHNVGLWNEDGELRFYVSSEHGDSSLIEPPSYSEVVTVRTRRLESFIDGRVKCLKVEAEGAEPEILEGIGDKLGHIEYIVVNVDYERGIAQESTLIPVMNHLISNGFELIQRQDRDIRLLFRNRNP